MFISALDRQPASPAPAATFTGSTLDLIGKARKQLTRVDALLVEAQRIDGSVICKDREQKVSAALSEAAAKAEELAAQLRAAVGALKVEG